MKKIILSILIFNVICISGYSQEVDLFEIPNEYQIKYSDKWEFTGNKFLFKLKFKDSQSKINFAINNKTVFPIGCDNAKLASLDYSNQYYSSIETINFNDWSAYVTSDFNQFDDTGLCNQRIFIPCGSKSYYGVHVSGIKKDLIKNKIEIDKLLKTIEIHFTDELDELKEIQINKDSLSSTKYKELINKEIVNNLLQCKSVKIDDVKLATLIEYFRWKSNSNNSDVNLVNYNNLLQFFDLSNFESLKIEGDQFNKELKFYDKKKNICTVSFELEKEGSIPMNEEIKIETLYFDRTGKMYYDKNNNKMIDSTPILFLNGNAYPLKIKRKSIKVK
jgi:hypothetical protein